jgi:hypothetical protein
MNGIWQFFSPAMTKENEILEIADSIGDNHIVPHKGAHRISAAGELQNPAQT